jgi:hypothetical protein
MSECPHGLDEAWCSTCKHPYKPPEKPTMEFGLIARFGGQCGECNLPIYMGQHIAKMSDDTYRHYECAP